MHQDDEKVQDMSRNRSRSRISKGTRSRMSRMIRSRRCTTG